MMAKRRNPRGTAIFMVGVGLASIVGIVAVTQFRSSPEPPEAGPNTTTGSPASSTSSAPETTTTQPFPTTTVPGSLVERGTPFTWTSALELEANYRPLTLLDHEGTSFLFTSRTIHPNIQGLAVWASEEGAGWSMRSEVAEPVEFSRVASTGFGILAFGTDTTTGETFVWHSTDGASWESTSLAAPAPGVDRWFDQIVANDNMVVVRGGTGGGSGQMHLRIRTALESQFGVGMVNYSWNQWEPADQARITVFGPLGVPIGRVGFTDLGLDPDDFVMEDPMEDTSVTAWVSNDATEWVEVPGAHWASTSGMFVGSDGRVWATTYLDGVWGTYATSDARTWELVAPIEQQGVSEIEQWPNGFIGTTGRASRISLSDDGLTWREFTLGSVLTNIPEWHARARAGGPGGIAVAAWTSPILGQWDPEEQHLPQWTDGETTVVLGPNIIQVMHDDTMTVIQRHSFGSFVMNRYDPDTGELTLVDPETGEDVVTLDAAAISELEESERVVPGLERALLFSNSATWPTPGILESARLPREWTVQNLAPVTAGDISHLMVTTSLVVMVATGPDGIEILVGTIPN